MKRTGPWQRGPYDVQFAYALQALRKGIASAAQQQYALDFIVRHICEAGKMSFWPGPDGDRATAFAEGKRWVANEIGFYLLPVPEQFVRRTPDGAPIKQGPGEQPNRGDNQ